MAELRKLVMNRTARLMMRIAIRRVVLMMGILSVVGRCWKVRKGMRDVVSRMNDDSEMGEKTAVLGRQMTY